MLFRARFLALLLPVAAGCMTERPTINRVQPDYMDKLDLIPNQYRALTKLNSTPETLTPQLLAKEPVFVTQNTLIAKPTNSGFVGLTSYSSVDKIRWQVTEDSLIGRQSYEFIKNAPGGAQGIGGNVQTGDVVAAFTNQVALRHPAGLQHRPPAKSSTFSKRTRRTVRGISASTCASTGRRTW